MKNFFQLLALVVIAALVQTSVNVFLYDNLSFATDFMTSFLSLGMIYGGGVILLIVCAGLYLGFKRQ